MNLDPQIWVALIGGTVAVLTAVITAGVKLTTAVLDKLDKVNDTVGTKNGHGSIADMGGRLVDAIADIRTVQRLSESRMSDLADRIARNSERLGKVEQMCAHTEDWARQTLARVDHLERPLEDVAGKVTHLTEWASMRDAENRAAREGKLDRRSSWRSSATSSAR